MKSMTAYSALEKEISLMRCSVEIKGYNGRYLDINTYMPQSCRRYENDLRRVVSEVCRRGKVEVSVFLQDKNRQELSLNTEAVLAYKKLSEEAARVTGLENNVGISELLRFEGAIEGRASFVQEKIWNEILEFVRETLRLFEHEREREGLHTEAAILRFISEIETSLASVESHVPNLESEIKTSIKKRFEELGVQGIDGNRILAEIAILLMKWTIAEEVCRLKGHLKEFRAEAANGQNPGKKLDFLCQEMAREINTMGSKTPQAEVSRLVVNMKEAVENIREQLRNIE